MPKISVIIPCYNTAKYLPECMNSIFAQTLSDIEILCIDDGSTDNTLELLKQYAARDNRIRVFSQENQGAGAARNVGLAHAMGEFLAFMDPDDFYPDAGTLELLYTKAREHNVAICGGIFGLLEPGATACTPQPEDLFKTESVVPYSKYQWDWGFTRYIYRRELIARHDLKFPKLRHFEDPVLFVRAMHYAGKFCALPQVTYVYRVNYKQPTWPKTQVMDLLRGLELNLMFSCKHGYEKLHARNVMHIEKTYSDGIARHVGDADVESQIRATRRAICPNLLQDADAHICNLRLWLFGVVPLYKIKVGINYSSHYLFEILPFLTLKKTDRRKNVYLLGVLILRLKK